MGKLSLMFFVVADEPLQPWGTQNLGRFSLPDQVMNMIHKKVFINIQAGIGKMADAQLNGAKGLFIIVGQIENRVKDIAYSAEQPLSFAKAPEFAIVGGTQPLILFV